MDKITFKKRYRKHHRKHPYVKNTIIACWYVFANGIKHDNYFIEECSDEYGYYYVIMCKNHSLAISGKASWYHNLLDAKKNLLDYIYSGPWLH